MKNKIYILIALLLGAIGVAYYLYAPLEYNEPSISRARDEVSIYETEAESEDECSSYESYDAENKVCYYECKSDAECKDIESAINEELSSWTDDEVSSGYIKKGEENAISSADPSLVSEYSVTSGEKINLIKGSPSPLDSEVWNLISNISPDDLSDKYIDTYQVFESASDDTLAFVDDEDGDGKWRIAVNLAGYRDSSTRERNLTVVHELGHIITLNNKQVINDKNSCTSYSTDEGCAIEGSYLNSFVNKFWSKENIAASQKNNNLYTKDKYVTEYASTNPEEDLAESFAYFVIGSNEVKDDTNSIKESKIAFFNSYGELLQIKNEMLNGLKSNIIRARKLSQN